MKQNIESMNKNNVYKGNFWILIYALFVIIEILFISTINVDKGNNWTYSYSILIFVNYIVQTFLLYKRIGLINYIYIFVTFYYILHFGQVVMLGFFPWYEYDYLNYVTTYMTGNSGYLKETLDLCINCINIFVLGAVLCKPQRYKKQLFSTRYDYKKIIKYVFLLLFSVRVVLDSIALFLSFSLGYEGTFESFIPGVISALGVMGYAVIPLYYFSIDNTKTQNHFLYFILAYLCFTMLSGNRAFQMMCIASLFITYLLLHKLTFQRFIYIVILSVLGLFFIDFIFDMRTEGFNAFLNSNSSIYDAKSKNIIFETIGSFGETIYTPYLVFEHYKVVNPFWGECFVKSLATIVPDLFGSFKEVNNEAVFAKAVSSGHTIGGSFAGEMFYNFGYTYYLPTFFIGYLFSKLSGKVTYYIKQRRIDKVYISLPVCMLLLWWTRDSVGNMTREIVWLYIIFGIGKKLSNKKKYEKSVANS